MTIHLAEALAALHRAGYLHGDVKPSNIGFTADGLPKLLDFGLARPANNAAVAGGTLRYLSPEVLSGRPAQAADDVWSLCVVLYEMVSGDHPFADGEVEDVTERIRRQRLGRRVRSASDTAMQSAVVAFAATVLAAARSARPATARAFADALGGCWARNRSEFSLLACRVSALRTFTCIGKVVRHFRLPGFVRVRVAHVTAPTAARRPGSSVQR